MMTTNNDDANTDSNKTPEYPACHIYAQTHWHAPVYIRGNRLALRAIRDAIDAALTTGMDGSSESIFTSDGEGYHVEVSIRTAEYLEETNLPYVAPHAGGVGQHYFEQELEMQEKINAAAKKGRTG